MGVRFCSSAQPAMPLEFWSLNLPGFAQGSGQPLTAAWLCFMLKYGCQAPIAANALVSRSVTFELIKMPNQGSVVWRGCACSEVQLMVSSHTSNQILLISTYLKRARKMLTNDSPLKFGSCRSVKQYLPANVRAFTLLEGGFVGPPGW